MRILVTGANGQVGHELLRALMESPPLQGEGLGGDGLALGATAKPKPIPTPALPLKGREKSTHAWPAKGSERSHAAHDIIPATRTGALEDGTSCERIDLADPDGLARALDRIAPDLIVNAAAYTAVDRAEDEPELAMRVNGEALGEIGAWASAHGARVVHYSTDYVFDGGATRPYREDDATHPLGVYGRSKLAGEVALRDSGARRLILRTAWVYGARGHNFLRTMLRLGTERDELRVVDDQVGAPTSAALIADATAEVIGRWFAAQDAASPRLDGTYHLVASGSTSWCGFARAIFERAALGGASGSRGRAIPLDPPSCGRGKPASPPSAGRGSPRSGGGMPTGAPRITAIATADYPTKATRPAYSVLDTSKLREAFDIQLPDWQTALDGVITELTTLRS